jgi:hypothetical protein
MEQRHCCLYPGSPVLIIASSWIREFMDLKGQIVLANYLNTLTHRRSKGGIDVDMELELLKCLKRSLSNKVGFFVCYSLLTL